VTATDDQSGVRDLVARALAEDLGPGDATADAVVPEDARARARILQKAPGVLFGLDAAEEAFAQAGADSFDRVVVEGQWRDDVPAQVALVSGSARALLAAERTALNLLGHLSGVATLSARYAKAIAGTGTVVLDTRKTLPGLRSLQKAAVAAGGGRNHRMGLYDAILIKENHAALAGGVGAAVRLAAERRPDLEAEVECRDLAEVGEALGAGATRLLLDNMGLDELRAAVAARDEAESRTGTRAALEASGGIDLATIRPIAETGVDFISVGALTHSAPALDVSMLLEGG
jgi:nicotinate-nucleotide pyrophosphorylase (carboxylating)